MLTRKVATWLIASVGCAACSAQVCEPVWSDAFAWGGVEQVGGVSVQALIVFDDGSGDALYVATDRSALIGGAAGGFAGRFDGYTWHPASEGLGSDVKDFAVFDDGSGQTLYAVVHRDGVSRWNGRSWEVVGDANTAGRGEALAVYDDGTGAALYNGRTRWDGTNWSWTTLSGNVADVLAVVDDGAASVLYGAVANELFRLENGLFEEIQIPFRDRLSGQILTMTAHDDGSGMALYVGGDFNGAAPQIENVSKFDGMGWVSVGDGLPGIVLALANSPFDGSLIALGAGFVAKWDGTTWETVEDRLNGNVLAAAVGDMGKGERMYMGGSFENRSIGSSAVRVLSHLAMWDGQDLLPIGNGLDGYMHPFHDFWPAMAFAGFDDGSGPAAYVGGGLVWAGQTSVDGIARWDGQAWSDVGGGLGLDAFVYDLEVAENGAGASDLYAAGLFSLGAGAQRHGIARWDGVQWSQVSETNGQVLSLLFVPDGPLAGLYAGGFFTEIGGVSAEYVARLDLATGTWSAFNGGFDRGVMDLAFLENSSETAIFACGQFATAGGQAASGLARWDGSQWQGIEISGSAWTRRLDVCDIGVGPRLFLAGPVSGMWDGSAVAPNALAAGLSAVVGFDDGLGPAVYFGGFGRVVRWDGASSVTLPMSPSTYILTMERVEVRERSSLFFGGDITHVRPVPLGAKGELVSSGFIAEYIGCDGSCYADCDQSTGVGVLDLIDFICFGSSFVNGEPYACDCDTSTGPGVCDLLDFICFQSAFVAGCP